MPSMELGSSPLFQRMEDLSVQVFQVIRTRIRDVEPNQVMEIATHNNERVAKAIAEIWSRLPGVRSGHEKVRIVRHYC